ncbi:unnamed protein product [Dibothriocephalus latus]|uniref:DNA recombination and repair protein Rad51-like C-terminal domain-containing protein n=1 Tax=Dibothriocephalus latus TaxID=60516 RepID=A0A3P7M732_DIBLA|nr:unnamed protein product [Dibothriocephalus latus]
MPEPYVAVLEEGQLQEDAVVGGIPLEFLFNTDADYHRVLFDLICRCTLSPALGGLGQACVLLDTEATFSMLEFGAFIDTYLAAKSVPCREEMINKVLDSVFVVSARTVSECILGLWSIRDLLKRTPTISLLLIDSISACFGPYLPRKDWAASQTVFFDMLSHLTDHFRLSSVVCRLLANDQEEKEAIEKLHQQADANGSASFDSSTAVFKPALRIHFLKGDYTADRIPVRLHRETSSSKDGIYYRLNSSHSC